MKALNFTQILRIIFFYFLMTLPFLGMILSAQVQKAVETGETYESILQESFGDHQSGATAIVARNGKVLYRDAIGMADIELGVEMRPEYVFRIGSITKQFTAVAIMQLEEAGKLSISDPITKFIPDYPTQGHTITIEHLLNHTSGIMSYTNMPDFENHFREDLKPEEIVDLSKDQPMEFAPGEKFNYNNSGYILLGVIIEKVSGKSYADYLQEQIFDPLGMENSHYGSFSRIIPRRVSGYQGSMGDYRNADFLSMTLPYAAGSLLSNVDDLYTWIKAVHAHKLVGEKSLSKAFSPYTLKDGKVSKYGYGWRVGEMFGHPVLEHGGGINGFLTQSIYLPDQKVFVAVLSNCNCQGPALAANKMAALAIGRSLSFEKMELPADALEAYVGIYEIGEGQQRKIARKGKQLYSTRTGGNREEIYPAGDDRFYFENGLFSIQFERDDEGKVVNMKMYRRGSLQDEAKRIADEVDSPQRITLEPSVLQEYVGSYAMGPFDLHFTVEDGKFFGQPDGQSKEELFATAKDKFFLEMIDVKIEFIRVDGVVKSVRVFQGSQMQEGDRKVAAAESSLDLREYVGVYESEGRRLVLSYSEGQLYGAPEGESREKLLPKGKDKFLVDPPDQDPIDVEFQRRDGKVSTIRLRLSDGNEIFAKKIE